MEARVLRHVDRPDGSPPRHGERFETLVRTAQVHIERIVSSERPDPVPYCQDHDELAVVLRGGARMEVAGHPVRLAAGDAVWLPAGTPHRVLATDRGTVWLAVHVTPPTHPDEPGDALRETPPGAGPPA